MALYKNNLQSQITLLCLSIVLITTFVTIGSFWWFTSSLNQQTIEAKTIAGQRVLTEYLAAKEKLLVTAARVLTADFGFKQAVATRDAETIGSVLDNHGARIDAELMLLADLEGELISASNDGNFDRAKLKTDVEELRQHYGTSSFSRLDGKLYQLILLPVEAPREIAYSVLGFEIEEGVVRELKALTGMDVLFVTESSVQTSTLSLPANDNPRSFLQSQLFPWFFISRPAYDTVEIPLSPIGRNDVSAILVANLAADYSNFDNMIKALLMVSSSIMLLLIMSSGVFARTVASPLSSLIQVTRHFSRGQYLTELPRGRMSTEVRELFSAFSVMGKEIKKREEQVVYQARHDLLTGFYNRRTMLEVMDERLAPEQPCLVFAVILHGLREIHESMGQAMADNFILKFANRLETAPLLSHSYHARFEGVAFLSVMPVKDTDNASELINEYCQLVKEPVVVNNLSPMFRISIGVARYPEHGSDAGTQVHRALTAMDTADERKLSVYEYRNDDDKTYLTRLEIINSLRDALVADDGQLFLTYQPKLNLINGRIEKAEALIRWQSPVIGSVSPEQFISLAEKSGLIIDLTSWVLEKAISQMAAWHKDGTRIDMAINVSGRDLCHSRFVPYLEDCLTRHGVAASSITLEITERDILQDEEKGLAALTRLRESGITISLDDYGVGESSLGKLKQLAVDELKIDKLFIMTLDQSEENRHIVQSTITLGHNLGMKVVVEGVENQATIDLLIGMGCNQIQGYHLAKPMKSEDFIKWLKEKKHHYA